MNRYRLAFYGLLVFIFILINYMTNWENLYNPNYLFIGICCSVIYFLGYIERDKEDKTL